MAKINLTQNFSRSFSAHIFDRLMKVTYTPGDDVIIHSVTEMDDYGNPLKCITREVVNSPVLECEVLSACEDHQRMIREQQREYAREEYLNGLDEENEIEFFS